MWYPVVLGKAGENMTTLENLYYGNIAPHENEVVRGITEQQAFSS